MMSSGEDETPKTIKKWIIEAKVPDESGKLVKRTFVAYTINSDEALSLVCKYLNDSGRKIKVTNINEPRLAEKDEQN